MLRIAFGSVVLGGLLLACSYGGGNGFGEDGASGGPSADDDDTQSSSGGTKVDPPSCTDGKKSAAETDVDCGGNCATKCSVGKACNVAGDCAEQNLCTGGTCAAPTGTDKAKNGDESDVDCGGQSTGAPRCAVGQACAAGSDCASGGCDYNQKCVAAPSCVAHFGGDTCGEGEIGSDEEQHESCCVSLPVDGFTDAAHPGKTVTLDKYEVTAGRVRAFVDAVTAEYGGVPNLQQWVTDHPPAVWNPAWTQALPLDAASDFGLDHIFGAYNDESSGFHVHGQDCHHYEGSYGYGTWWYPDQLMSDVYGSPARSFGQNDLDTRAMSCIPNAVLAAFCAWDGGQLATVEVLEAIDGIPQNGNLNISIDAGQTPPYVFPGGDYPADGANRVSPPGRALPGSGPADDRTPAGNGQAWADLAGNLLEMSIESNDEEGFALLFEGVGSSSAHALQNDQMIPNPAYKAASSGGRCMRFQ